MFLSAVSILALALHIASVAGQGSGAFDVGGTRFDTLIAAFNAAKAGSVTTITIDTDTEIDVSAHDKDTVFDYAVRIVARAASPPKAIPDKAKLNFGFSTCLGTLGSGVDGFTLTNIELLNMGCAFKILDTLNLNNCVVTGGSGTIIDASGEGRFSIINSRFENTGIVQALNSVNLRHYISNTDFIGIQSESKAAIFVHLQDSMLELHECKFSMCHTNEHGGAVYAKFTTDPASTNPQSRMVKVVNTIFEQNFANGKGGAVYIEGDGYVTLAEAQFDGNTANHGGGALAMEVSQLNAMVFESGKTSSFKRNSGLHGGALWLSAMDANAPLTLSEVTFEENVARGLPGGGAVYIDQTNANSPAAPLSPADPLAVTFANCKFTDNQAFGGDGGAVYTMKTLIFTSNIIAENSAMGQGGAVWGGEAITSTDSTFTRNWATSGGAIWSVNGITTTGSAFNLNEASPGRGGAIYIAGDSGDFDNTQFTNNFAENGGGALYAKHYPADDLTQTLRTNNVLFSRNVAGASAPSAAGAFHIESFTSYYTMTGNTRFERNGGVASGALVMMHYTVADLSTELANRYLADNDEARLTIKFSNSAFLANGPWDFSEEKPYEFCEPEGPDMYADVFTMLTLRDVTFKGKEDETCDANGIHSNPNRLSFNEVCSNGMAMYGPGYLGCTNGCEIRRNKCLDWTPVAGLATCNPGTVEPPRATTNAPTGYDTSSPYAPAFTTPSPWETVVPGKGPGACEESPKDIWPPPFGYRAPGGRISPLCSYKDDTTGEFAAPSGSIAFPQNQPGYAKSELLGWKSLLTGQKNPAADTVLEKTEFYRRRRQLRDDEKKQTDPQFIPQQQQQVVNA